MSAVATANISTALSHPIVEVRLVSKIYPGPVQALNDLSIDFPRPLSSPPFSALPAAAKPPCSISSPRYIPTSAQRDLGLWPLSERSRPRTRFLVSVFRSDALSERDPQCRLRPLASRHSPQRTLSLCAKNISPMSASLVSSGAYPHELSGRMRHRVFLSLALVSMPTCC